MSFSKVTDSVLYVGVDDTTIKLFENQYDVADVGVSYNSYVIMDEKIVIMDTVDARATDAWLANLKEVLGDKTPDYLVVSHMEPDHASNVAKLAALYPNMQVVGNAKTFVMIGQFFGTDAVSADRQVEVKEGSTLEIGKHCLTFLMAPMVHWPETMVAYESTEKILFSADGFGRFGALSLTKDADWAPLSRRYYLNIVGKYGVQVQALLKKAATVEIQTICPLHGPVLTTAEEIGKAVELYQKWSTYQPEAPEEILIAYASIHGNTEKAARKLVEKLQAKGASVILRNLATTEVSFAVAEAFYCGKMILASATYDSFLFPPMEEFLTHLKTKAFQKRKVGLIENGTWAPTAARQMKTKLEELKDIKLCDTVVTIKSALNAASEAQMDKLVDEILAD